MEGVTGSILAIRVIGIHEVATRGSQMSLHGKMTEFMIYLEYHTTSLHGKTTERRRLLSDVSHEGVYIHVTGE